MAIYRLWLLSLNDKSIIYSRYFPHLEKRDQFMFPWITPQEFVKCLFISLGIDLKLNDQNRTNINDSKTSFPYSSDVSMNSPIKYNDGSSSSSSCSLTSMNSFMSTSTLNTSIMGRQISWESGSFVGSETNNIMKEYVCLYNHLPLIIVPIVNVRKPDNCPMNMSTSSDGSDRPTPHKKQQNCLENLAMLVYEQNGYLFVCCPRLTNKTDDTISTGKANGCLENDKLLVDEHNISLAYTILQMLASVFFAKNKSIQSIECFITTYMPFGNLIKTKCDHDMQLLSTIYPEDTRICLRISESISTSFKTNQSNESRSSSNSSNETIFGTFSIDFIGHNLKCSKAEIMMNISNFGSLSLVLPTNCMSNENTLIYDLSNRSEYSLNLVHYKSSNPNEHAKTPTYSGYIEEQTVQEISKFFRVKYKIYKQSVNQQSPASIKQTRTFVDPQNVYHVALVIVINDKIQVEEINFKYFMVKFSLNRGLIKKQVQTMDNSLNNLLVRESLKVTQGRVKNENNSLLWMAGNRLSRKMAIEFDLVITRDYLANLDTECSFNHSFRFKSLLTTKPNRNNQTNSNSVSTSMIKLKECKLNYPKQMIIPFVHTTKLTLAINQAPLTIIQNPSKSDQTNNDYLIIDYNFNSFQYRFYPKIIE